ncbi:MAG: DegQ family serine endoprotease, partial [Pseudomonadota bacterium]
PQTETRAHNEPDSVADLAEDLPKAVVNISTAQNISGNNNDRGPVRPELPEGSPFQEFFEEFYNREGRGRNQPRRVQSLGSGFVIDPDGIIITNNHVIADADEITANFADGTKLVATVIGRDEKTDLAVLKVEPESPLPSVEFGRSSDMRVGDWVMAIGNPFGLGGTVTAGIVSAINRDINAGPYDNFIQTDAAINRGNSGGPLFNRDGQVIGINTAIFSPSGGGSVGIGFSVPSDTAVAVISQLRAFGETRRGWLGVRIQQVTDDIAEGLGIDEPRGALVAGVTEGGPAAKAGILSGDVVLEFDGRRVEQMRDLPRMVADTPVGKEVDVLVLRKGQEETVQVNLGRLEEGEKVAANEVQPQAEEEEKETTLSLLGLTIEVLSDELRENFKIPEQTKGVVITAVEEGSSAEEKGVRAGEVILEVSQEAVTEPADVKARVEALSSEDRKSALLLLSGADGELRFVALKIEE